MKKIIYITPILFLLLQGCIVLTQQDKIIYTTYKSLQTAKEFRKTSLQITGEVYKDGYMSENMKSNIISVGNHLQNAINNTADALQIYKQTGNRRLLHKNITIYQQIYGEYVDLVLPYVIEKTEI